MQGTGRELLSDGMQVRLLGATGGLGLEPTSAVHAQERAMACMRLQVIKIECLRWHDRYGKKERVQELVQ